MEARPHPFFSPRDIKKKTVEIVPYAHRDMKTVVHISFEVR